MKVPRFKATIYLYGNTTSDFRHLIDCLKNLHAINGSNDTSSFDDGCTYNFNVEPTPAADWIRDDDQFLCPDEGLD